MSFRLVVLGNLSAFPTKNQITSAQVLTCDGASYVLDCGEGTQMKMSAYKIKRNKIRAIFISHLHGDHLYGLPGLIGSLGHHNRKSKLVIVGPTGLDNYLNTVFKESHCHFNFEIDIKTYDPQIHQKVYEDHFIQVKSLPLKHRIPTMGFLIKEKDKPRNIIVDYLKKYRLSIDQIRRVKKLEDIILPSGESKKAEFFLLPPKHRASYAYCSDTSFNEDLIPLIAGVDVLYHETTYKEDLKDLAVERGHSTTKDAARIAQAANVGKLLIGHFSSRYYKLEELLEEVKELFPCCALSFEGQEILIDKKCEGSIEN